jgi:hypothetical protein
MPGIGRFPPGVGAPLLLRNPTEFFARAVAGSVTPCRRCVRLAALLRLPAGVLPCELPERGQLGPRPSSSSSTAPPSLVGRRNTPHIFFGNQDVERIGNSKRPAPRATRAGTSWTSRFARMWRPVIARLRLLGRGRGGEPALPDRLIPPCDRIDSSDSFVRPLRTAFTPRPDAD